MDSGPNIHQTAHFSVLSISYEKADAEVRGKFSFFDDQVKDFVQQIHANNYGDAFVVSTCNRTEIYTTTQNYLHIAEIYCKCIGVSLAEFLKYAVHSGPTELTVTRWRQAAVSLYGCLSLYLALA